MTAPLPPRSGLAFLRHDVLNLFLMRQLHVRASVPDGVVVPRSASSRLRLAALMTVNLTLLSGCLAPPPLKVSAVQLRRALCPEPAGIR